ncbi:MAG: hypothetical protein LBL69_07005 [Zoogloeaceae bacterium]|jgi:uroporphyrin-III C-methyltransferase/precorrin-2 dehydrogenase/sirohydrochlorin ferrochelatase|nr:hypothetical protein [Zoogloeaceae bacterium]
MNVLPIALTPKNVLLIGAGKAAAQKRRAIEDSGCALTVIAREIVDPAFADFPVRQKAFDFADLDDRTFDVLVDASGDLALARALWEQRKTFGYLLNCVDLPEYCDFYFGATIRDHDLCVSVSSGGASPAYAQKIRDLIGAVLPRQTAAFYAKLRAQRPKAKGLARPTFDPPAAVAPPSARVFLIGCGPGKRAHLTLEALRLLPTLEVALIDALVGPEIIDLLSPACEKIDVGKRKGRHTMPQEEINALLLTYARRGLRIGRLKGGDPAIFGRLAEEVACLQAQGIIPQVVGGLGSFQVGALAASIFPTVRGKTQGLVVVSAHLREALFNDDWLDVLKTGRYTVAVLMAHSFAAKIVDRARARHIDLTLPVAFVSQIDRPDEHAVFGTLGDLPHLATRCPPPAVLFICSGSWRTAVSRVNVM